jgi:hypothetical protein
MKLTRIIALAAAVMIPATWTMATAGEPAPAAGDKAAAPAGEKTEKTTKSKKSDSAGDSKSGAATEKKAEKK